MTVDIVHYLCPTFLFLVHVSPKQVALLFSSNQLFTDGEVVDDEKMYARYTDIILWSIFNS